MTPFRFDSDTAGTRTGEATVDVHLHSDWNVDGRILNGGYLQAVAVRAAAQFAGRGARPIAVSTTFAAPATPGDANAHVETLRAGSRIIGMTVTLRQDGAPVLASLVTFAGAHEHRSDDGVAASPPAPASPPMPTVTPADEGIGVTPDTMPGPPGLARLLDYRFVPETSGWLRGDVSAVPHIQCWLSFADGRPADGPAAAALVDMAPPVSFAQGRFGWAPTLQLQVALFADPADGPLLLDLRGEPYEGSVVVEDGLLWDRRGTLIARSRQIALAPRG